MLHGRHGGVDRAMTGDQDDFGVGEVVFGPAEDLHAINIVHHQVGNDNVVAPLLDLPRPLGAGGSDRTDVADPFQALGHRLGVGFVVVDEDNLDWRRTDRGG